jgi:hypothetical protein
MKIDVIWTSKFRIFYIVCSSYWNSNVRTAATAAWLKDNYNTHNLTNHGIWSTVHVNIHTSHIN